MKDAINSNFKENKVETDLGKIKNVNGIQYNSITGYSSNVVNPSAFFQLIQQAVTVEDELRTKIIQAVETAPGHHGILYF